MSFNEEELIVWMNQTDKRLAHLEANQVAIINGDFWDTNTESKKPLIDDGKIRKAIRVWAEANEYSEETRLKYSYNNIRFSTATDCIEFSHISPFSELEDESYYSINELCGEGEE